MKIFTDFDLRGHNSFGVSASAARLVRLYGTEAIDVIALGAEPLAPGAELRAGEVEWAVANEGAVSVEDVLYRRTRTALYEPDERESVVEPIGQRMAERLGWTSEQTAGEVARVRSRLSEELSFVTRDAAA